MDSRIEISHDFGDPIKHEARLKLWLPALRALKNSFEGKYLKYFTLPGPKAYDVIKWQNEDLIEYDGRGYPGVCFCDMNADNFANAKRILGNTRGVLAKFEDIVNEPNNPIYKAFWDLFPYDVYNLDFCGTWFEDKEPISETFTSIINLVNTHVSKRNFKEFLLFLTIRIDMTRTNHQVIKDLRDNLLDNCVNQRFSNKIHILTGNNIEQFSMEYFYKFILVSIPKLIANKLIPRVEKLSGKIENIKRAYYRRNHNYYIGKFIFLIGKEKTNLRINPIWYERCVSKSLDFNNVIKISKATLSRNTENDLKELKKQIMEIENYG